MRRVLLTISILLGTLGVLGAVPVIHSADISVHLIREGTARITEVWDMTVDRGTEWYLVRENLGDMSVGDLRVTDETGREYVNEGSWKVDRSLAQKAGRCGIASHGSGGVEICWGLGDYGHHRYTASYTMTKAVKSLDDFDFLHMQFVSPGLSNAPSRVTLSLAAEGTSLSSSNSRVWAFGYDGTAGFTSDGKVEACSSGTWRSGSSMILLLRFDKGIFQPVSVRSGSFDSVLGRAMDGADFGDSDQEEDHSGFVMFAFMVLVFFGTIFLGVFANRKYISGILGVKSEKEISWSREVPFGGDILKSDYVLGKLRSNRGSSGIASAMILRMIEGGQLVVTRPEKGKAEISFNGSVFADDLPDGFRTLYEMMRKASGRDEVLQANEFSRWSASHAREVDHWVRSVEAQGAAAMVGDGFASAGGRFTEKGKESARGLVGFGKFLKDFTLINERASADAGLWNDYLVFGALFGIADKVAKELSDIDPRRLSQTVYADPYTMRQVVWMTNRLSASITNASAAARAAAASARGYGGHASFGGGGGFSGGGFGGGIR